MRERSLVLPVLAALSMLMVLGGGILAFYFVPNPELLLRRGGDSLSGRRLVHLALEGGELVVPYGILARVKRRTLGSIVQVDLQVPWPYEPAKLPASPEEARDLGDWIILSFEPGPPLLDPPERLEKIYTVYFAGPPAAGPGGLKRHAFAADSPYADLELFVSPDDRDPVIIRCDLKPSSLGPILCEARISVSDQLMMRYRFAQPHLGEWRRIDALARSLLTQFYRPAPKR
jgi:hypothetical protein